MAFRQPTFAPPSRSVISPAPEEPATRSIQESHALEDSREWIFFPSRQSAASYTQATSTDRTPRTAGLSRLSDFGSLNSGLQSGEIDIDGDGADAAYNGSLDEEDEGLDSLDDGLHAFQEPSKLLSEHFHASSNSILPRHDGLGGFPTSTPGLEEQRSWLPISDGVRSRKRSFGVQRRRTSINMERGFQEAMLEDDQSHLDGERRDRIEKWRLDHSRVLLNEIEKETRRRRASIRSHKSLPADKDASSADVEGLGQIFRDHINEQVTADGDSQSSTPPQVRAGPADNDETLWERLTRRVIRDFMGIDDDILSVILGESLIEKESTSGSPPFKAPRLDDSSIVPTNIMTSTWEKRLIDHIARELGIFLSLAPDRPAALNVPASFNPTMLDYAGLSASQPTSSRTHRPRQTSRPTSSNHQASEGEASPSSFTFNPTLHNTSIPQSGALETSSHAALWGIEEEPSRESEQQEYWESTPSLREIFQRFLHTRFPSYYGTEGASSSSTATQPSLRRPPPPIFTTPSHNVATTSTPDNLRRAALIRQHHPLTSRAAHHRRRRSWLRSRGGGGSSCASESVARRSTLARSSGAGTASTSRNYWDIGCHSSIADGGSSPGVWGEV